MTDDLVAMRQRQRDRLAEIVAFARAYSPYYRRRYRGLPDRVEDPALLPVVDKPVLMENFDEWVTDRSVTLAAVQSFVDDPELIGEPFHGKYLAAATSGTTGRRGLYLLDEHAHTTMAEVTERARRRVLGIPGMVRTLLRGGRFAQVSACNGHHVSYASYRHAIRTDRRAAKTRRAFSVHSPLPELVAELNEFRPAILVGYTSAILQLAGECEAGRLQIRPLYVIPAGETVSAGELDRMGVAFGGKVFPLYGATECLHLTTSCTEHWYHVNIDWAVCEPVNADYSPTPPGEWSHSVLITNLANRVQPVLRYDLGDSVQFRPDPCPCGNPAPALRVRGRAGDVLTFSSAGTEVRLSPLAVSTIFDHPGVGLFQIEQTAPATLSVRLRTTAGFAADEVWRAVHNELRQLLASHGLSTVEIRRGEEDPVRTPGGKYRTVIPLLQRAPS